MASKRNSSYAMALGGILAALAVVIMSMGTLIPVATYVCPVISMLLLQVVYKTCGTKNAWAWYGAVAILGLLLAPDKEAAIVYCFLGYYPILKSKIECLRIKWLIKLLYFNGAAIAAYTLMIHVLGMARIAAEFQEAGKILTLLTLILGNVTFFLLDRVLSRSFLQRK